MPTIKYEGHACFLITTETGSRVMVDPYDFGAYGDSFGYGPITDPAEVVLITHEHRDHDGAGSITGSPVVLRQGGTAGGIDFHVVEAPHGQPGGEDRGNIRIFFWRTDGLRFCHLGDLGAPLEPEQAESIGPVDVLFIPVGGRFTIDAAEAHQVARQLQARVVLPMHYATARTTFPLAPVDDFLQGAAHVLRVGASEWAVTADTLPEVETVVVLTPAN
jgi:L-ascorbate metabolism protein UlaG (beta-lactamase superfamily)